MFFSRTLYIDDTHKSSKPLVAEVMGELAEQRGPVFVIGSWQSGDFCHIYAAAVRHFSETPKIPFAILILVASGFGVKTIMSDIEFALKPLFGPINGSLLTVLSNEGTPIDKEKAITVMSQVMKANNAHSAYDATFWSKEAVKKMTAGQPLTPVWAQLVRGGSKIHFESYEEICMSFMKDYVTKFGMSQGAEKFVCLWSRTSGMPTQTRQLGGANPQYDSSELGNHQLCVALKRGSPIKAIFIVGDGFNEMTKNLPYVFDLGAFWTKQKGICGRFQENGFFDFMTAFYNCDVVHVGMKSGGMDTLGLWGQKVVFIDSINAPAITKGRVAAWSSGNLFPVEISAMPTQMGKAIELQRDLAKSKGEKAFKTTFGSIPQVNAIEKLAKDEALVDGFEIKDLYKIGAAVNRMFG